MAGRVVIAALLLVVAWQAHACTEKSWDDDELVENTPDVSANGRFRAVVRWYEGIPDFASERAAKVFKFDDRDDDSEEDVPAPRETMIAAVYEGRRLIAEIPLDRWKTGQVLVSDSGRFLIATFNGGPCGGYPKKDDPVITIYRTDGGRASVATFADVLSPSDAAQWPLGGGVERFSLRQERDGHEVVVLTFFGPERKEVERRIDVATGALLDERNNIYPAPRVFATPVRVTDTPLPYEPISPECTAGFADAALVRLGSGRFFTQAVHAPLPPFPILLLKARVRTAIRLELLVSETGDVLCARPSRFPFGVSKTADEAVRRWKFTPYVVDGRAVRFAGELVLHFEDVLE